MASILTQTFEETLKRIQRQPQSRVKLAIDILMWIAFAMRPLTVSKLQYALAVPIRTRWFDKDPIRRPKVLVDVCAGLVTIEENSDIIRVAHYTVKDFLLSRTELSQTPPNLCMARAYLDYMLLENFKLPTGENPDAEHMVSTPF